MLMQRQRKRPRVWGRDCQLIPDPQPTVSLDQCQRLDLPGIFGWRFPYQRKDRRLWYDQVFLLLEGDLDRCAAEKNRIVADLRLYGKKARLAAADLPRLL